MSKKSIVELTSAGITSEEDLKELMQAKKQNKPVGFAKTAAPTIKIEKTAPEATPPTETNDSAVLLEAVSVLELPAPATYEQIKSLFEDLTERHAAERQELETENQSLRSQNEASRSQVTEQTAQIESLTQELTQAQKDAKVLEDLGRLAGRSIEAPMVNTQTRTNDSPGNLVGKLLSLREETKAGGFHYDNESQNFVIRTGPTEWIRDYLNSEGKSFQQTELYQQLEEFAKSVGFLSGKAAGPTTGASGSAPNAFLDVLSDMMRSTSAQFNAAWQFATTVFDGTSAPNKNVLVPRFDFLPDPDDDNELIIANTTTFNPPGYAIGTNSDSQALRMTTVALTVIRYGLGRGLSEGSRPVFIPEFHQAYSLVDLQNALESRLMAGYYRFEERRLLALMILSTAIRYNDNGRATATPANVAAGDKGIMSRAFLRSCYTEMVNAGHQSLPDGCYVAYLNAVQIEQLKGEIGKDLDAPTPEQRLELTNMLRLTTGITPAIRASTYLGMIENFHVFMGNSFGKGSPGANNPTVNNTTLGAGATVTVDGFLMAPGAIGRGVASPMEIRPSGVNPYGMGEAYIWTSDESFGALDVDAALGNDQQTKVLKVRTTLTEV